MKRVLTVLEYSGDAPQDRVRGPIFKDLFTENGGEVHYFGRHPPPPGRLAISASPLAQRLSRLLVYQAVWRVSDWLGTCLNDWRIARRSREFDVIHLIKVGSLDLIRKIRLQSRARIVYDLGDALWQPAYAQEYPHINEILSSVDAVTCDNPYGLAYARQFNDSVFLWPPPSQVEMFDRYRGQPKPSAAGGRIVIGWLGSHSTVFSLYVVWEALEKVAVRYPQMHLRLVGVGPNPSLPLFERVPFSARAHYTPEEMAKEVLNMDIGLFPMFDVENSIARGILKALIYMSGEAVAVCSPRGQVNDLIADGVNGMLANSTAEWCEKLERLIVDPALRRRIAAAGLETVREGYTLRKSFENLRLALQV